MSKFKGWWLRQLFSHGWRWHVQGCCKTVSADAGGGTIVANTNEVAPANTFTLPAHHRSRHLSGERAGGDLSPLCGVDKGEVTSPSL